MALAIRLVLSIAWRAKPTKASVISKLLFVLASIWSATLALAADTPRITSVQLPSSRNASVAAADQIGPFLWPAIPIDLSRNSVRDVVGLPAQRMITTQPRISIKRPLVHCNSAIKGQLVDFTHNHGIDNRFPSTILNEKRDVYVYLPPGYDANKRYPLVVWLHGAFGDEHAFIDGGRFDVMEKLIACGKFPPAIMVCPDGTYEGENKLDAKHSFYINGKGGAFEDYLMQEILPWIESEFPILPGRQSRAIFGISGGGYGAMSLAIRHRDYFSTVAVLAAPVNVRYQNCTGNYFAKFDPATYRWNEHYEPERVVGKFFLGTFKLRARKLLEHVFGYPDEMLSNVKMTNPADLLFSTQLKSGDINMYLHYPGKDNFNFDAHAQSFAWLAHCQGIHVDIESQPSAHHLVRYFRQNIVHAYEYIGKHLNACEP